MQNKGLYFRVPAIYYSLELILYTYISIVIQLNYRARLRGTSSPIDDGDASVPQAREPSRLRICLKLRF